MNNNVSLNPVSIALVLAMTALLVILAGLAGQLAPHFTGRDEVVTLFNLDSEQNIPTFFSVVLMLGATLLLGLIAIFKKAQGAAYTLQWAVLACGFLFMSIDEAMSIHEKLNEPMSGLLGKDRPAIFHFAWVVPGIAVVVAVGLFFLKFLLYLPAKTRLLFVAAATLYLGGVIVVELIGNYYAAVSGTDGWAYIASATIEEGLEMAGIIVFIFALLKYMAEHYGEVRFRFHTLGRVSDKPDCQMR